MQITHAVAAFLNQRRQRRRAPPTIDQYHYQLVARWLRWRHACGLPDDLSAVARADLRDYFGYLARGHINERNGRRGLSAETCASAWRTLRAFWRFCAAQGWLLAEQRDLFQQRGDFLAPAAEAGPPPPVVALPELLDTCARLADPEERARNRALLRLIEAGLRPGQIAALTDERIDLRERCALIERDGRPALRLRWGYPARGSLTFVATIGLTPFDSDSARAALSHERTALPHGEA